MVRVAFALHQTRRVRAGSSFLLGIPGSCTWSPVEVRASHFVRRSPNINKAVSGDQGTLADDGRVATTGQEPGYYSVVDCHRNISQILRSLP